MLEAVKRWVLPVAALASLVLAGLTVTLVEAVPGLVRSPETVAPAPAAATVIRSVPCATEGARDTVEIDAGGPIARYPLDACGNPEGFVLDVEIVTVDGQSRARLAGTGGTQPSVVSDRVGAVLLVLAGLAGASLMLFASRRRLPRPAVAAAGEAGAPCTAVAVRTPAIAPMAAPPAWPDAATDTWSTPSPDTWSATTPDTWSGDGPTAWPPADGPTAWPSADGPTAWPPADGPTAWPPADGPTAWPPADGHAANGVPSNGGPVTGPAATGAPANGVPSNGVVSNGGPAGGVVGAVADPVFPDVDADAPPEAAAPPEPVETPRPAEPPVPSPWSRPTGYVQPPWTVEAPAGERGAVPSPRGADATGAWPVPG